MRNKYYIKLYNYYNIVQIIITMNFYISFQDAKMNTIQKATDQLVLCYQVSATTYFLIIQSSLRTKDTLGTGLLSFARRLSLSRRFMIFQPIFDCMILNKLVNALKSIIRAVEMIIKWLVCSIFIINIEFVSEVVVTPKSLSGFKANIIIAHAA